MSIIFNEQTKTITLQTKNTSYQMKIGNLDYLLHLYYGPTIYDADMAYQIMQYFRGILTNREMPGLFLWMPSRRNSVRSSRGIFVLLVLKSSMRTEVIHLMGKSRVSLYGRENTSWKPCLVLLQRKRNRLTH